MANRILNRAVYLVVATSFFVAIPSVSDGALRTYEFLPNQDRLFSYGGGLLGTDVAAQLAGSFDVEIESDGTAQMTRFDVHLIDIVDTSLNEPVGWMEGELLRDQLFLDPVGLTGQRDCRSIGIGPMPVPSQSNGVRTNIYIEELDDGFANVRISSRPETFLDNPSMSTESPGFMVRVVPEPAALLLIISGALTTIVASNRRRKSPTFRYR